jgi:Lar family restriction alleviation protein
MDNKQRTERVPLRECPFCGECDQLDTIRTTTGEPLKTHLAWKVLCECGATGPAHERKDDAIIAWNAAKR